MLLDSSIWDVQSVHQVGVTGWSMQQRGARTTTTITTSEREYVNVNVAEPYYDYRILVFRAGFE